MSTQSFVTAILLLGAVACGGSEGNDTPLTQPTTVPRPTTRAPVPASDIVGDYRVTFAASASCSLPTETMKRTYDANVRAWVDYGEVAVDVSGGAFLHEWAVGFGGTRDGDTVSFTIVGLQADDFSGFYDYGLAEVIDQTKWLTYDGTAVARIAGHNITTGTFDGLIKLHDAKSGATLAECRATDHKIEFVR